jgi:hypothetical protein
VRRSLEDLRHAAPTARSLFAFLVQQRDKARLKLTTLGRERYHGLPNDAAMSDVKDEAATVLRRHILHTRDR